MTPTHAHYRAGPLFGGVEESGAEFSADRLHRLKLWRQWDTMKPAALFVMLNPSLADETTLDPTVRKCIGFATRWGYGKLWVGNLYTWISPYPEQIVQREAAAIAPGADQALLEMVEAVDLVIAAWGAQPWLTQRAHDVSRLLVSAKPLWCLGKTKDGWPRHPLYRSYEAALEPYAGKA